MARDTKVRYEALLIAVREVIDVLDDASQEDKALEKASAILKDAMEEIGEPIKEDPWAV